MASLKQVKQKVQQANEVYDLPITNLDGSPYGGGDKPVTIGIVGKDSKHYRDESLKFQRAIQKLPRSQQDKVDWRRGLAACACVRWAGWEDPFSAENLMAALDDSDVLEQVEAGIRDHASFFPTSSPS